MLASGRFRFAGAGTTAAAGTLDQIAKLAVISPKWAMKNLRLLYFNGWGLQTAAANGTTTFVETVPGNAITISGAAIEHNGTFAAVTFNGGSTSVTLASGAYIWSDPVAGLTIPANTGAANVTGYYVRTDMNVASAGMKYPGFVDTSGCTNEQASSSATAQTSLVTSGTVSGHIASAFGPIAVAAQGWDGSPVLLGLGDSTDYGKGDNMDPTRGVQGMWARGLDDAGSGALGYCMWCVPSQNCDVSGEGGTGTGHLGYRIAMLNAGAALNTGSAPMFTSIGCGHGTNDAAGVATANPTFWAMLRTAFPNVPIYQKTLTPHTNDNGNTSIQSGGFGWSDDAHQSPNQSAYNFPAGAVPVFNAALNAGSYTGPAGATFSGVANGYIDAALSVGDLIYDASGNYAVPAEATTLAAGCSSGQPIISTNNALTVGAAVILNPGGTTVEGGIQDGGGLLVKTCAGTGPFTVTLDANLAQNHLISEVVGESNTNSGLHPNQPANIIMMAGIVAAKNAGTIH